MQGVVVEVKSFSKTPMWYIFHIFLKLLLYFSSTVFWIRKRIVIKQTNKLDIKTLNVSCNNFCISYMKFC